MESLLDKLYYDKYEILAHGLEDEKYKTALDEYAELYQKFQILLSEEQRDSLDRLLDCHNKLEGLLGKYVFRQGFKLGVEGVSKLSCNW